MDRIFEWVWDKHGPTYSWAMCALIYPTGYLTYLAFTQFIVAFEGADIYLEAALVLAVFMAARVVVLAHPFSKDMQLVQGWAKGLHTDRAAALEASFAHARKAIPRAIVTDVGWMSLVAVTVGLLAGASGWRLVQYGVMGAGYGAAVGLMGVHSFVEGAWRPVRASIAGDTALGDSLPRSHPTFAAWSNIAIISVAFAFAFGGALVASVFDRLYGEPILCVLIAVSVVMLAGPMVLYTITPFMRPIRDLAEGTERVAAGDYVRRLPVVQDDDLGALSASFNRMQAGLAERQRLQAAFGSYVDPVLAARLLAQGDDVFTGERRAVTVMFIDIRDFTPFAEANTAEDTVARLNALFEIVVPVVVDGGGHVNKFLGDGALAVFGAPNDLADHADAAVGAAAAIHRRVCDRFAGALRIGIGINTGVVIAGTIGGAGKLEFTLIGDTVNVAARVEQLTKTTGDSILLAQATVDALDARPAGLTDRGLHELKGKSAAVKVFGLDTSMTH